jgi:hypothetical protein
MVLSKFDEFMHYLQHGHDANEAHDNPYIPCNHHIYHWISSSTIEKGFIFGVFRLVDMSIAPRNN